MAEIFFVVTEDQHNELVCAAFRGRGYSSEEVGPVARLCADAARHGIRTHNAIKALHLDALFGSRTGGCRPGAEIEVLPSRFPACVLWDAHRKIGPAVAYQAMDRCIELAEQYGVGMVSVDNAFHYFWGGGYVLDAARKGFIGYTQCTAMLAEVVPFGGRSPTLGTNPHSWGFPTQDMVGFPVIVDWATSAVAMGRVQQLRREGGVLPPGSALDEQGEATTDPARATFLLPFGGHKGYGLGLINEIVAGMIGGSIPTVRGRHKEDGEKHTTCFQFMAIHPEAVSTGRFSKNATMTENLKRILDDILGPGNEGAILPGQIEAREARRAREAGGLLFTETELTAFDEIAAECDRPAWDRNRLKTVTR